jgi:hypothetical protein
MTSWVLGYNLAFLMRGTPHHLSLRASSRYGPIARERWGLLRARSTTVNNPA